MNKILKYSVFLTITVLVIVGIIIRNRKPNIISDALKPVAVVSKVTSKKELKNTDGRTNILLLGVDGRAPGHSHAGSKLTDTILLVSIDKKGERPVFVSIPRDLWITQYKTKINSIYQLCYNEQVRENGRKVCEETPETCVDPCIKRVEETVEHVTGVPIHYYTIVGFDAFKEAIDTVGGIDVNIEEAFDDYQYPIEGKENAYPESERYKHIHFDAGIQHLDSEQALEYARSRHSTNQKQAGDFARARRQQQVILALKDKLLSTNVLFNPTKIKELYESYKNNVKTDITLGDAMAFYDTVKELMNDKSNASNGLLTDNVVKIVLSSEEQKPEKPGSGLLIVPEKGKYTTQWIVVPKDETFDEIHGYIQRMMFESPEPEANNNTEIKPDSNAEQNTQEESIQDSDTSENE